MGIMLIQFPYIQLGAHRLKIKINEGILPCTYRLPQKHLSRKDYMGDSITTLDPIFTTK